MQTLLVEILGDLVRRPLPDRCARAIPGLALATAKGPVREENQDRALAVNVRRGASDSDVLIVAVSDGMGGMADGGGAASVAISAFVAYAAEAFVGDAEDLEEAAHEANAAVYDAYRGRGGATLTAAAFTAQGVAFLAHCGDSRLYGSAPDSRLTLLTRDDTPAGQLAGEDLEADMSSQLIQFVGVGRRYSPSVAALTPRPGASWLLSTDGAHMIGRTRLRELAIGHRDPAQVADRVVETALAMGGWDNATVAVVTPDRFWRDREPRHSPGLTAWTPAGEVELR